MTSVLFSAEGLLSLLTLTLLEIVLGIDNVIFISIVSGKLPKEQQGSARQIGILLALAARVGLLLCITFIMGLKHPWLTVAGHPFSGRDVILFCGGGFLVFKTLSEILVKLRGLPEREVTAKDNVSYTGIIFQIVLVDIVFSFDSILTAVGLVQEVEIMIAAVIISMGIMYRFSGPIGDYVNSRPTVKMLALVFLVLIGVLLAAEAFGEELDKSYVYFAMAFAFVVELLNQQVLRNAAKHRRETLPHPVKGEL